MNTEFFEPILAPILSPLISNTLSTDSSAAVEPWSPLEYFADGEQGLWYDPSDFNRYMAPGPELVTNGTFDTAATGWLANGQTFSVTDGVLEVTSTTAGAGNAAQQVLSCVVGQTYLVSGQIKAGTGGRSRVSLTNGPAYLQFGTNSSTTEFLTISGTFVANVTNPIIQLCAADYGAWGAIGDKAYFDNISVVELTGIATATLFQDADGTTPVTAVEQSVGLILDKKFGLVRGPELVAPTTTLSGWTALNGATLAVVGDEIQITSGGAVNAAARQSLSGFVVGKTYDVSYTVRKGTCVANVAHYISGAGSFHDSTTATRYTRKWVADASSFTFDFYIVGVETGTTAYVSDTTVKLLDGSHAKQTTAPARPRLSARVNVLTKSEQFDDAVWNTGGGLTVTPNAAVAPDGTMTADRLNPVAAADNFIAQQLSGNALGTVWTFEFWAWTASGTVSLPVLGDDGSGVFWLPLNTTIANVTTTPTRFTFTGTSTNAVIFIRAGFGGFATWAGETQVYVWGAQLTRSADTQPYQRVNTATDYDTVGFPLYLAFDGVDDNLMTSSAVNFSGTDKLTVMAGLSKEVSSTGLVLENFNSYSVPGSYYILAGMGIDDGLAIVGRGSATVSSVMNAYKVVANGTLNVLAATSDISGDSSTIRVNGAAGVPVSYELGTGNFTNEVVYIGCRAAGPSYFYLGKIFQLILRGALTDATGIYKGEKYVGRKTEVAIAPPPDIAFEMKFQMEDESYGPTFPIFIVIDGVVSAGDLEDVNPDAAEATLGALVYSDHSVPDTYFGVYSPQMVNWGDPPWEARIYEGSTLLASNMFPLVPTDSYSNFPGLSLTADQDITLRIVRLP